jgi:hypothetical protein
VKPLILRLLGRPEVSPTTPPPKTFRMWPACHRRPSLVSCSHATALIGLTDALVTIEGRHNQLPRSSLVARDKAQFA